MKYLILFLLLAGCESDLSKAHNFKAGDCITYQQYADLDANYITSYKIIQVGEFVTVVKFDGAYSKDYQKYGNSNMFFSGMLKTECVK